MGNLVVKNENSLEITPQVKSLIEIIRSEIDSGMERARLAMEQEKRQTYWNVGKHIKEHLLQNEERAEYGDYLFPILSQELNIDKTTLYRAVKVYEEYPEIVAVQPQLNWSHLKILVTIKDEEQRKQYEDTIVEKKLTEAGLKELMKKDKGLLEKPHGNPVLHLERGEPWVYRLKKVQNKIVVDLGFRFAIESPLQNITPESVMKVEKKNQEYHFNSTDSGSVPYYTYKAYLIEVIDGDTLWVDIDLGFGTWTTQKLRFRGINTKEIETASGKSAKEYIENKLKGCPFLVIKTYWRDKFTRYLADVFYDKNETDYDSLIQDGKFLNQELLDKGFAVRYE